MADLPPSISLSESAKMLDMTESELQELLDDKVIRPGDRRCIQAAVSLLQTKAMWKALNEAMAASDAKKDSG